MDAESKILYEKAKAKLDLHYSAVKRLLVAHQSPTTGLFSCGDIAHVRDSVYCAAALWALGLAYRRIDDDGGRGCELEYSAVKCMRGILTCYMRQASKVEKFKSTQTRENAIHCMYHFWTGDMIDGAYPHLQQEAVALFLLYLVQMTSSGLQIIFNTDEVAFVQNLVYYLERSYRVPDFGTWRRGSKYNNGSCELHASAVGAAKAALESANGFNLFGKQHGAPWSVLWVDMDAHNRNRTVVDTLLPKESVSKNSDSAIIPVASYPFFAVDDNKLCDQTKQRVRKKLEGKYGFKRFAGDGYKTVVEDRNRKYYRPAEIKLFNGIECEWPLFFIYMIIDGAFHGDRAMVEEYQKKLQLLLWTSGGTNSLVPRFYYVDKDDVEKEYKKPGASKRRCSFGLFDEPPVFLWGQALYVISQLLVDDLISRQELDPIRRYVPLKDQRGVNMRYSTFHGVSSETTIQVVLIAESEKLQAQLETYGIMTQTSHQVEPIQIWPTQELVKVYEHLGVQKNLGLSGRPNRPIGALATSKMYRILGRTVVCYPLLFDVSDFYMGFDAQILLDEIEHTISFINKYWRMQARPLFVTLLREEAMRREMLAPMLEMLSAFKRGEWKGLKIRVGKMQSFVSSTVFEHLEFVRYGQDSVDESMFRPFVGLDDEHEEARGLHRRGSSCSNLSGIDNPVDELAVATLDGAKSSSEIAKLLKTYQTVEALSYLLGILIKREGLQYPTLKGTARDYINRIYRMAAHQKKWDVVRHSACLSRKVVDSLAPAITNILVKGRHLTLGVFSCEEVVIANPLPPSEIQNILYTSCFAHNDYEACLQQELVLHVSAAMSDHAELFEGMLQVRVGWLVHAMKLQLENKRKDQEGSDADGELKIYKLSPSQIKQLMMEVLKVCKDTDDNITWLRRRQVNGALNKAPSGFYGKVWSFLERSPAGFVINGNHMPQQPTISDMSPSEVTWCKLVEEKFQGVREPEYRHILVETLVLIGTILERNPELRFHACTDVDSVIADALAQFKSEKNLGESGEEKECMNRFYDLNPSGLARYLSRSIIQRLLESPVTIELESSLCSVC